MSKTILVTGGAGYIGTVLTRQLLAKNYQVVVFDNLTFGGEGLLGIWDDPLFKFVYGDLINKSDVDRLFEDNRFDAVIHLAAIVGDPACAANERLTRQVNRDGANHLYNKALNTGVSRFIFSSTCSNYGKMGTEFVDEDSQLNPVSLYARTKVEFEQYILSSANATGRMISTPLRFATAYGLSPRMRFDLTVNEFIRDAVCKKELVIYGEQFWRPYCHIADLSRAMICTLEASPETVSGRVFGVGSSQENYQKKMLADEIQKLVPDVSVKYVEKVEDPRDYRVKFDRINKELGFELTRTVPMGLQEIHSVVEKGVIPDPYDARFRNI